MKVITALALLVIVCLMPSLPVSSQSAPSNPYLQIVFASEHGSTVGLIYVINPDGTHLRRLSINGRPPIAPACSPEGKYIAFYSELGLQVADSNFADIQIVVPRAVWLSRFSLSENASKVAFVEYDEKTDARDIYVSNKDGRGLKRLTTHPASDVWPAISPDGTKVVFGSNRGTEHNNYELYIVNTDGSNLTQLTDTGGFNADPDWSPGGTKIAFTSDRAGNNSLNIYVMNPDGSNPIPLTNDEFGNYQPSWSPDGEQIAFVTNRDDGNWEIYVLDADGTNQIRLTHDPYFKDQPCWLIVSPNEGD